jgi:hypothetical protein
MGLDIIVESQKENHETIESCYELSRRFCWMIRDLVKLKDSVPEIVQIAEIYDVDISLIQKMNVWELEQHFWEENSDLTAEDIATYYEKAWQNAEDVLVVIKSLYTKIQKNPSLLSTINLIFCHKTYFEDIELNKGKYVADRNFGWDLRNLIEYLSQLESGTKVKFHFF